MRALLRYVSYALLIAVIGSCAVDFLLSYKAAQKCRQVGGLYLQEYCVRKNAIIWRR